MPLPPSFLDELRQRIAVSDVVGRRVRLTRAGREFKGLCPFHREKTPSFTVNDDKGFFHCFGCGAHGDIVGFVMQHDRRDFMEAVEMLAADAGLSVPQPDEREREQHRRRKTLHELLDRACRFFEDRLASPGGAEARAYLVSRGLSETAVERYRLGFAPADGHAVAAALEAEGFEPDALIEAGLLRTADDGRRPYPMFRNRILFPVSDARGRVVGFGARLLDGDGPKYLNSPDGPLFQKGTLLYGLSHARMAARDGQPVIVAEGYMDVIALQEAGFGGAVAPLGTALTETQIQTLWRTAAEPVLCFDGDEAGRRAAWRAADRILPVLRPDHSARFGFLPAGDDPDSLLRRAGVAAMRTVLDEARSLADVIWDREGTRHRIDSPEGRAGLKSALEQLSQSIADPGVRTFYRSDFRRRVGQAFFPGRGTPQRGDPRRPTIAPRPRRPGIPESQRGHHVARLLLVLMIEHPHLFDEVCEQLAELDMADPTFERLKHRIVDRLSVDRSLDSAGLRCHLEQLGLLSAIDRLFSGTAVDAPLMARVAPEDAHSQWQRLWDELGAERRNQERQEAVLRFEREPTEENWARLMALPGPRTIGTLDDPEGSMSR